VLRLVVSTTKQEGAVFMMGRTHVYAGVFSGFSYLLATGAPLHAYPAALGAAALASLLPDVDEQRSQAAHALLVGGVVAGAALKRTVGHRTFTHSILVLGLLTLGVHLFWPAMAVSTVMAGVLGFASHLVLDAFTPEGVELLWPIEWRMSLTRWLPVGLHLFRTHGFLEVLLFRPLLLAGVGWDVVRLLHVFHVKLI
jgi:inner membrane protein